VSPGREPLDLGVRKRDRLGPRDAEDVLGRRSRGRARRRRGRGSPRPRAPRRGWRRSHASERSVERGRGRRDAPAGRPTRERLWGPSPTPLRAGADDRIPWRLYPVGVGLAGRTSRGLSGTACRSCEIEELSVDRGAEEGDPRVAKGKYVTPQAPRRSRRSRSRATAGSRSGTPWRAPPPRPRPLAPGARGTRGTRPREPRVVDRGDRVGRNAARDDLFRVHERPLDRRRFRRRWPVGRVRRRGSSGVTAECGEPERGDEGELRQPASVADDRDQGSSVGMDRRDGRWPGVDCRARGNRDPLPASWIAG
jgi:hypothetical protein